MQQRNLIPNRRQVKGFSGCYPLRETPKILGVLFSRQSRSLHDNTARRMGQAALCASLLIGGMAMLPGEAHAGVARGKVVDRQGKPLAGLVVKVLDQDNGSQRLINSGKTNAKGDFAISYPSTWKDRDANIFGGSEPDIHISVEIEARYTTGNFYEARADGTAKTKTTKDPVGELTKVYDYPGHKQNLSNYNPRKDLNVGVLRVDQVDRLEVVRTSFDPLIHGFNFYNVERKLCWGPTCKGDVAKSIFSTRQALCGGMALSALERFAAGRCDAFSSANLVGGKLPPDLKKEFVTNIMETFLFWTYQTNNDPASAAFKTFWKDPFKLLPTSSPGFHYLEWQAKTAEPNKQLGNTIGASTAKEWPLLVTELRDRKLPVVLGLINARASHMLDFAQVHKNHQVLAIGYDHDPMRGAVTLYVYDPNAPREVKELYFSYKLDKSKMYLEYPGKETRGFFVSTRAPRGVKAPRACPKAPR